MGFRLTNAEVDERPIVKHLVLSHLIPADDPAITDEMWASEARKHFTGQVTVGKHLLEI